MKLYLSSLIAYNSKRNLWGHSPFLCWATGDDHAVGKAMNFALEKWPIKENWYHHQENTIIVPDDVIQNIIDTVEKA